MTAPIREPVAPAPVAPPRLTGGVWIASRRADVRAVLADPRFEVPAAPSAVARLGWLRGAVSRFANRDCHRGRQALAAALIEIAPGLQMPRRLELRLP